MRANRWQLVPALSLGVLLLLAAGAVAPRAAEPAGEADESASTNADKKDTPAASKAAEQPGDADADRAKLEAELAETLSGAALVGYYTTAGQEKARGLVSETYRLGTVKKLAQGDYWSIQYRYGDDKDALLIPLPPLEIKWAGDTPVITLTDFAIPGIGTFTARVLFYRGEYCGTWSAGDHGGQLFGKIVKDADLPEKAKDNAPPAKATPKKDAQSP